MKILRTVGICPILILALVALFRVGDKCDAASFPENAFAGQGERIQTAADEPADEQQTAETVEAVREPLIKNDAVIFGLLMAILGFVFWSSNSSIWLFKGFYKVVPMLLMCYFLPSLLTLFGVVDPEHTSLWPMAKNYLLPASLVLLTLSTDLREIFRLGPKALIMFLVGTVGVIVGGPLAILIVSAFRPEWVGGVEPNEVWRGLTTIAGSWIGGGANQVAMKEVWGVKEDVYTAMVAVDVLVAEFWMMFLLLGVGKAEAIDRLLKADSSAIERLKVKMEAFSAAAARIPSATDLMVLGAIAFAATAFSHFAGDLLEPALTTIAETERTVLDAKGLAVVVRPNAWVESFGLTSAFFWIVVLSTTAGVLLSFTPLRQYEGVGASKMGTVFIFVLVAVIGMKMDLRAVVQYKELFVVGLIWMMVHVALMVFVAWLIRAPYFFLAVGSKANIGGAASAPVVAAAFHPSLAPVGVLLAVLGYALGTYGALLCGYLMRAVAP